MRANHSPTTGGAWMLAVLIAAGACRSGTPTIRSPGLERQLEELALVNERDSLLMEVAANGRLLTDIQAELARVQPRRPAGTVEDTSLQVGKDQRTYALEQVRLITTRLQDAETQLARSERRARRLAQKADSLNDSYAEARTTIEDLVAIVSTQRETMAGLNGQVEWLASENSLLADSVFHLTDDRNTAFYVVGTREELLAKGVLVESGHRSIPLVGRRDVRPAGELPLAEFTSIDRLRSTEIPLPRADRRYRIVSGQNLTKLADDGDDEGRVSGTIAIANPEGFWEPSRYLIVVEQ